MLHLVDEATMRVTQISLQHGHATLLWPRKTTADDLDHMQEVLSLQLRSARRIHVSATKAADAEYESWVTPLPDTNGMPAARPQLPGSEPC